MSVTLKKKAKAEIRNVTTHQPIREERNGIKTRKKKKITREMHKESKNT